MDNFDYEALKDRIFHRKKLGLDCATLEHEALSHRRANDIYEVGDKVIHETFAIHTVVDVAMDGKIELSNYESVEPSEIRHITDAEREAGCKL